jgi:hypothetical protein
MGEHFRRATIAVMAGIAGATLVLSSAALAQGEPPARVGRLAFTNGAVSFHDAAESVWRPAVVNTPLTTGDAIWTEPNARSEITLAGARIRMEGASELDMLALDDTQTRMRLSQGRIDVRTFSLDASEPYQVVTPRGTISLLQQGDYYVEAGSLKDPTRLGVRSGAAQIEALNGQVMAVRPGEVGEILGDAAAPELRIVRAPPPAPPAFWANRDRQIVYDQAPQYIPAGVTGYEDLNAYGNWLNDSSYGMVWVPRAVPAGWAPYRTGRWIHREPWGWTWIDDQPWGFTPYHYGRWANRNNRWMWVPPQRDTRPVYAPALVAFVGGVELAVTLNDRRNAPVGWFPLGPREVYVPPYTTNRDYYRRINRSAAVQDRMLDDRWRRTERREGGITAQTLRLMNQRYATVVPTSAFVQSQPVNRAALRIAPDRVATVPVVPVSAPPAPTLSITRQAVAPSAAPAPNTAAPSGTPADSRAQAQARAAANIAVTRTQAADMPTLAKPATIDRRAAPGPKVAAVPPATAPGAPAAPNAKPNIPTLVPRQGAQPPQLQGTVTPVPTQPGRPGEPPARPDQSRPSAPQPPAVTQPARPGEPPPQQTTTPSPQPSPQPPRPAEPQRQQAAPSPQQQTTPQPPRPAEPGRPQAAPAPPPSVAPQPSRPAEPPRQQAAPPAQQQQPAPQPPRPAEPQRPQAAPAPQPPPASQPPRQAEPPRQQAAPPAQRQPAPQPPRPAEPQRQQAVPAPQPQPAPQPPRQVEPPRQQVAPPPVRPAEPPGPPRAAPQAPPQQAVPPPAAPRPPQEGRTAPTPAPRPQAAPPAPAPNQAQSPRAQPQQQAQPPRPAPQQKQDDKQRNDDKK